MKIGYVLLDGCADRPHPALNFTTPLEAAYTPHLDDVAASSRLGTVTTVGRGISPESDIAVFNMLGYSFGRAYPGRGVIEAVGAGLRFWDGQLALRANLATAHGRVIVDRRAGRDLTQEEAERLGDEINGIRLRDAEFEFKPTVSYRGVLVIRTSQRLSANISNTDPAYARVRGFGAARATSGKEEIAQARPETKDKSAALSAELVNEFTEKSTKVLSESPVNRERVRLGKKPANCLLFRDAGDHLPKLESFETRYGMKGTAIVDMPAEVGIASLLGMRMVKMDDRNDLVKKGKVFSREMREGTVVYVHIKGPDEFGHDGDVSGKKKCVERIDRDFFSVASAKLGDSRLAVSCDHATPCALKMHSSDPVPLLVTTEGDTHRDGLRFTEKNAKRGSLGRLMGREVLGLVTGRRRLRT
jgi:2,3-bisphosphoglycerate-independent phosphoglycerate mutase